MAKAYYGSRLSQNMTETPEGFLICLNVPIARTGSQQYLASELEIDDENPNKVYTVYRTEEEVFSPATIASFEGKPTTDDHPPVEVAPDNISAFDCGHAQNVRRGVGAESDLLIADLFITNKPLIEAIKGGRREVSCGYNCEYTQDENGNLYQRSIRGNHIAVVSAGRAGHRVAIKDSKEPIIERSWNKMNASNKERSLFSRLFSHAVKDMKPEEIEDAVEEMAAAAAGLAPTDAEPELPVTAPAAPAAPMTDKPCGDAEGGDVMLQLLAAINKMSEKLDAMCAGVKTDAAPEAPVDPMKQLEDELNGAEKVLPENLPQTPDADPEAAVTVPAEEIKTDAEPEEAETVAMTNKDAAIAALNFMKPIIAAMPATQRKAASDRAVAEIRKLMGKDSKPVTDGYKGIANVMQQNAKKGAKKTTDDSKLGADIMKSRNPHYKG